jgi:hypothetical protein
MLAWIDVNFTKFQPILASSSPCRILGFRIFGLKVQNRINFFLKFNIQKIGINISFQNQELDNTHLNQMFDFSYTICKSPTTCIAIMLLPKTST